MAHPYKGKASDSRKVARERYQGGGVVKMPSPSTAPRERPAVDILEDIKKQNQGTLRPRPFGEKLD